MIVAAKIKLADARAELRMTQAALAALASLSKQVITNAEKGVPIQRISAHAILKALNHARQINNLPTLTINDIEWKIAGDNHDNHGTM
jgi:DNA-binding XRE family transcriptional regulator